MWRLTVYYNPCTPQFKEKDKDRNALIPARWRRHWSTRYMAEQEGAKKRAERLLRKLWFTTSLYFPRNWNQLIAGRFWNHKVAESASKRRAGKNLLRTLDSLYFFEKLEPIICQALLEPLTCRNGKLMVQVTQYRNTTFNRRVLYCAWDNLKDEQVFFEGIHKLEKAGIPPSNIRAYMLIGFDKNETWDRIWYRFKQMVEREIEPYPMVFHQPDQKPRADLKCFQRWTNLGLYRFIPWADYRRQTKSDESVAAWLRLYTHKKSGN